MKATVVFALTLVLTARCSDVAASTDTMTKASVPVLVELFTSEGCSSCPPADALLQRLDSVQPQPGVQLIVLSEHVDYWDHDGWKDPYSSAELTERQGSYIRQLGLSSAYTPQFIVDGVSELKSMDAQQMRSTFQKAADIPKIPVSLSAINIDDHHPVLRGHIDVNGAALQHKADIYLALALSHAQSQVLKGENGGRQLTHVAVVLKLTRIGSLNRGQVLGHDFQLRLQPGIDPGNLRLVAFVQEPDSGQVDGVALENKLR